MTKALAVMAHHDDHLLFMGATIRRTKQLKGWDWTILAMCLRPQHRAFFCKSCQDLGAEDRTEAFKDYQDKPIFSDNERDKMEKALRDQTRGTAFDWVFTHSRHPRGEYGGHPNHAEVQQVVTSLVQRGELGQGMNHLAYFSYQAIEGHTASTASYCESYRTHYLQLSYEELEWKLASCKSIPDQGSISNLGYPCPNPEAYEGDQLALGRPVDATQ
jgi:LmbE family N-acetylglucosaminyl deacetylase